MANNGVVVEKGDNWIIVLFSNGEYKKISTKKYFEVGDLYKSRLAASIKYAAAAAVFILILTASLDFFNVVAYATVSPGIELGLNRWDRVVTVKTTSPDNTLLPDSPDLKGKKAEDALQIILEESTNQAETETSSNISVKVSGKNQDKLEKKLAERINQFIKEKQANQASPDNSKAKSGVVNSSLKGNSRNARETGNLYFKKEEQAKWFNNNDKSDNNARDLTAKEKEKKEKEEKIKSDSNRKAQSKEKTGKDQNREKIHGNQKGQASKDNDSKSKENKWLPFKDRD